MRAPTHDDGSTNVQTVKPKQRRRFLGPKRVNDVKRIQNLNLKKKPVVCFHFGKIGHYKTCFTNPNNPNNSLPNRRQENRKGRKRSQNQNGTFQESPRNGAGSAPPQRKVTGTQANHN